MSPQIMMKYFILIVFSTFIIACSSNKSKEKTPDVDSPVEQQGADASGVGSMDSIDEESVVSKVSFGDLKKVMYFDFDKSLLNADSRKALDKVVSYLKGNNVKLRLEGHTDERGSREYNMALGERRGLSVKDYLIAHGIAPNRLEVISYGEEKPAFRGSNLNAYAKNRRVELKLP